MSTPDISHERVIIAFIEDHPKTVILLRAARRKAEQRQCKWRAVFVETPANTSPREELPRERMLKMFTLVEQMGGEMSHIEAETLKGGIMRVLERERDNLEMVVIGSTQPAAGFISLRPPPVWVQMSRIASQYTQVEIVPLTGQHYQRSFTERMRQYAMRPRDALYALLAVGVAYLCALFLQELLPPALFRINDQNVALLFMIACAFVAGRYGLLPGLITSVGSFVTVNYFFTSPYHMLSISTITDALNMVLFLSAAVLISVFTSRSRILAQVAAQREQSTEALFTLYRTATSAHSMQDALTTLRAQLEKMLDIRVAFFLPGAFSWDKVEPVVPPDLTLDPQDEKALQICWSEMKTTGLGSPFNPGATWRFKPMVTPSGEIGVLAVQPHGKTQLDPWYGRLLAAIADQTATILQHIRLERSMEETRMREEREKLRAMLLSSVSHDFKTPLAGIIGALSVYRSLGERLTQAKRDELIETAIEEAQRLDNFITNILDMTRLESGNIQFRSEWHSMEDLIENVTRRMQHRCRQHKVTVIPAASCGVEARMDILMTEQVLQNVIDNVCKYTPRGTSVEIRCRVEKEHGLLCEIRDFGPGIPPEKLGTIFDKYTRLQKKDSQVAGTGLGLAIAKAVMEAQKGWITAANHPEGGAVFTLCLPEWRPSNGKVSTTPGEKNNAA